MDMQFTAAGYSTIPVAPGCCAMGMQVLVLTLTLCCPCFAVYMLTDYCPGPGRGFTYTQFTVSGFDVLLLGNAAQSGPLSCSIQVCPVANNIQLRVVFTSSFMPQSTSDVLSVADSSGVMQSFSKLVPKVCVLPSPCQMCMCGWVSWSPCCTCRGLLNALPSIN